VTDHVHTPTVQFGPPIDRRTIIVRRPSPHLADGEVTHIGRRPVDIELAFEQWTSYVEAFRGCGWEIIELDPLDEHPDGVFVEDAVVMYGEYAMITRPGAASRRGETAGLGKLLAGLGYQVRHIAGPGTLDGGDVLKIGDTIYVGRSGRTNDAGIEQIRLLFEPFDATVIEVPTTKVLHLKSAVAALPDGTVIGYEPVVDDIDVFANFIGVPEEPGAHVVDLGDGQLLMTARTNATRFLLEQFGYEVMVVDISEFEKLEGYVTCLSVRLRTFPDT
jgi:dimethylargininase